MDNQRLLVWAAFGVLLWLAYQTWMQDYGPKPAPPAAHQVSAPSRLRSTSLVRSAVPSMPSSLEWET